MSEEETRASPGRWFPDRLGACRLLEPLGRGGMGTVFLAELQEDRPYAPRGARVALKLLFPERLRESGALERLRREASLGARVRHPALMRIHEMCEEKVADATHHFLVMELVEGRSLRDVLIAGSPQPEPLVRSIGAQVAQALQALHEAGAVHRDVKPANVMLTPAQQVKLVDLGIARDAGGADAVTATRAFVGTSPYAAPEQFEGRAAAASDLYSLGVLLFEAATGTQPFAAPDVAEIERRHLHWKPPPAGSLNPSLSPLLEELIAWLLQKDPGARPPAAAVVAEILDRGEAGSWWRGQEASLRTAHPAGALRRVRAPRAVALIGRDSEMGTLRAAWARAREGHGSAILVVGEAGIGKSRLLDELAEEVEREDASRVLQGHGRNPGGLGSVGAAILAAFGEELLEPSLARHLGPSSRLAPTLAAAILGVVPPAGADDAEPPALAAAAARVLRSMAIQRPTLLVLEDLHDAGADGLSAALAVAQVADDAALLVVVTARDDARDRLGPFESAAGARRLTLPRLRHEGVVDLLSAALGSRDLAEDLGPRLGVRSDGNPYFLLQLVGELEQRRAVRRRTDGGFERLVDLAAISLPGSLRELVMTRIDALAEVDRALLEVGAAEGFAFDPDLVARVLGRPRLGVLQDLARLERRTGVVRAQGTRFAFDHHQLHEALRDSLAPALAAEYHRLLAQSWAHREGVDLEAGVPPSGAAAAFLAQHLAAAADGAHVRRLVLPALDHLAATRRGEEALDLAERSLPLLGDDPALVAAVSMRRATRLDLLGHRPEQRDAARTAAEAADATGDAALRSRCKVALGRALALSGDDAAAEGVLREAIVLARDDAALAAPALGTLGWLLVERRRLDAAEPALETALGLARRAGDAAELAAALGRLASLRQEQGRAEAAVELLQESAALAEAAGDEWRLAVAHANLARAHGLAGRLSEARQALQSQLTLCREIGYRRGEMTALGNLGLVHLHVGELEAARACFDRQVSLARQVSSAAARSAALGHLAAALEGLGEPEAARRAASAELEAAREGERLEHALIARALARMSRLLLNRGELDGALEHAVAAGEAAAQADVPRLRALATCRRAAAAAAMGRAEDGDLRAFDEALGILRGTVTAPELAQELMARDDVARCLGGSERLTALAEAEALVRRHDVADPGAEPAARLAACGAGLPTAVELSRPSTLLRRAASAIWLGSRSGGERHVPEARALLGRFAHALGDAQARERFWRDAPLARVLREIDHSADPPTMPT